MTVSSGIAMEVHYCMGKKAGTDFYKTGDGKCGRCGMKEKKGGCCNDEHKFYKLSDAHKNVVNNYDTSFPNALIPNEFASLSCNLPAISLKPVKVDRAPPGTSVVPIFLRNCVFRI